MLLFMYEGQKAVQHQCGEEPLTSIGMLLQSGIAYVQ
jgi:hypothetical protein